VVTFGAFVEILPGVEGLVHISELAQHHVENPREVVAQGQAVNVKIIEIDGERRRLSLSLKRVEPDDPVQPRADGGESVHLTPNLDLSGGADDVVADEPTASVAVEAPEGDTAVEDEVAADEPLATVEPAVAEPVEEPAVEEPAEEPAPEPAAEAAVVEETVAPAIEEPVEAPAADEPAVEAPAAAHEASSAEGDDDAEATDADEADSAAASKPPAQG
jgi:small subunit ribosomal protein S1